MEAKNNKQNPPVSTQDILDGGCGLMPLDSVPGEYWILRPDGSKCGMFCQVEWGHGASGMLFINNYPISKHPVKR
jgi:hypothetical protein